MNIPGIIARDGERFYRMARQSAGDPHSFNGCCREAATLIAMHLIEHGHNAIVRGPAILTVDSPQRVALYNRFPNFERDERQARRLQLELRLTGAKGLTISNHHYAESGDYLIDLSAPDWTRAKKGIDLPPLCLRKSEGPTYMVDGCQISYWHPLDYRAMVIQERTLLTK